MKRKYKTLIFDFDGTLADSIGVLLRVYDSLSEEFGLRELSQKDIVSLRDMTPQEVLKFINVSILQLPFLLMKGRIKYKDFLEDIEPIAGLAFVLMELQKKYDLHILTSNDKDIVMEFLSSHKISCFYSIMSERNIFGKEHSLAKMLKQFGLEKNEVLYIGDEVRDIRSCKKAEIAVAAVCWGLNSQKILKKENPDYLVKAPDDLLEIL